MPGNQRPKASMKAGPARVDELVGPEGLDRIDEAFRVENPGEGAMRRSRRVRMKAGNAAVHFSDIVGVEAAQEMGESRQQSLTQAVAETPQPMPPWTPRQIS